MAHPRLFHVSEEFGLRIFHPRPASATSPELTRPVVWAIDEERLPNYLLPRDCPRVCFSAASTTTPDDRRRFLEGSSAARVIAVEECWRDRVAECRIAVYELPAVTFSLHDAEAGYWLSDVSVSPTAQREVTDLMAEHRNRAVDLRFLPTLWPLHDAVASSKLCFSLIRMRNAQPRGLSGPHDR